MKQEETNINSYLSFKLDRETFGVNVSKVIEILEVPHITKIPKAPSYMRGVINLRGTVLPVVDTRLKLGLKKEVDTINTCIIVFNVQLEKEEVMVGALVDAVQEVFEMLEADFKPAPSIGAKFKSAFLKGMVNRGTEFIMMLDVDKVFSTDELIVLQDFTDNAMAVK